MAKTYAFKFTARAAEFYPGGVSVAYGRTNLAEETRVCTLADAVAHLEQFSAQINDPHAAQMSMQNRADRAAPGMSGVANIYRREAAQHGAD